MIFSSWETRKRRKESEREREYLQKVSEKNSNKAGTKIVVQEQRSFAGTKFYLWIYRTILFVCDTLAHPLRHSRTLPHFSGKKKLCATQANNWQMVGRFMDGSEHHTSLIHWHTYTQCERWVVFTAARHKHHVPHSKYNSTFCNQIKPKQQASSGNETRENIAANFWWRENKCKVVNRII